MSSWSWNRTTQSAAILLAVVLASGSPDARAEGPAATPRESLPETVHDAVFGVPIAWNALPDPDFHPACGTENRHRKVSARTRVGDAEIVLVQSLFAVRPDIDEEPESLLYEEDAGQLMKIVGRRALHMGPSSGDLTLDYPEIREPVIADLFRSQLETLLDAYPDPDALKQAIEHSRQCPHLPDLARDTLAERGIDPRCAAAGDG